MSVLVARGLTVTAESGRVLAGPVDLNLEPSTVTALVAPSGGGKSLVCRSLVGDLPTGMGLSGGPRIGGVDVAGLHRRGLREFRRTQVSYVGQDPGSALNPAATVESLLTELAHPDAPSVSELLDLTGLERGLATRRAARLSGGQQRRVALARAMSRVTPVLILDEPFAGLHQQLRADIVTAIREWAVTRRVAVLLTAHAAPVAQLVADHLVELGSAPTHVVTEPVPRPGQPGPGVLEVRDLTVTFGAHRVLDEVNLSLRSGTAVALMGDSGAGKSTLARALTGQVVADSSNLAIGGMPVAQPLRRRTRAEKLAIQLVPQDPLATLNPKRTVGATLRRALRSAGSDTAVAEVLARVGLATDYASRYPHMLSGGQRQRVAIARALAYAPKVLVCDEITSALDPAAGAMIMDLVGLEMNRGLAVLVITHDPDLAAHHCARTLRLADGRLSTGEPAAELH
ncbi:ATP-binding cassette domain-containing protein [Mycobacterium sp. 21AC1]|uniref:ABC transporter ATP-binding protein n=1 Tax=[Mycobacterium] appelbergii TaxID=2939269 RepID=UPI002938EECE|nr:ATP-binding cassette domain-containing protein [Mycobacterium sp. 21AC1]MDV3124815.1 ATP-binding cassette domain-containing protein [Mycobacterium sp. 21AC1]